MEIQHIDTAGIDFIVKHEGLILHPYKDQVGIPTIGIGATYYPDTGKKVTMSDKPITKQQAYDMFAKLARTYELAVYSTTRDDLNQNQFNALVSLCYNIGTGGYKGSTVHRLVNMHISGKPLEDAFMMWIKASGKIIPDLVQRRKDEFNLFIS